MFFRFPVDPRWNADLQSVEFSVGVGGRAAELGRPKPDRRICSMAADRREWQRRGRLGVRRLCMC